MATAANSSRRRSCPFSARPGHHCVMGNIGGGRWKRWSAVGLLSFARRPTGVAANAATFAFTAWQATFLHLRPHFSDCFELWVRHLHGSPEGLITHPAVFFEVGAVFGSPTKFCSKKWSYVDTIQSSTYKRVLLIFDTSPASKSYNRLAAVLLPSCCRASCVNCGIWAGNDVTALYWVLSNNVRLINLKGG